MIKLTLLLSILVGISSVSSTDYCSKDLCSGNHIACGNSGALGQKCPSGTNVVQMTPSIKSAILQSHNSKRNTIAAGQLSGFSPATRMATMHWDDELARLAELNVKRCIFGHDQCHNTNTFRISGQNIGKIWWSGGGSNDETLSKNIIESWWSEYKNANKDQISKYPQSTKETIGHFTVMTADRNVAVGCAAIRFKDSDLKNWDSFTMACNYATTNIIGRAMYEAGNTASKCSTGRNRDYQALCSPSEHYDVNKF